MEQLIIYKTVKQTLKKDKNIQFSYNYINHRTTKTFMYLCYKKLINKIG